MAKPASNTTFNIQNGLIMGHIPPPPYLPNSKNRILVGKFELKGYSNQVEHIGLIVLGYPYWDSPFCLKLTPEDHIELDP
ncbi:MAG: hypothetical protein IIX95_06295 [Clostridiales bacterium]|nr:hypothetical protein [Clostridiales bacterium]